MTIFLIPEPLDRESVLFGEFVFSSSSCKLLRRAEVPTPVLLLSSALGLAGAAVQRFLADGLDWVRSRNQVSQLD